MIHNRSHRAKTALFPWLVLCLVGAGCVETPASPSGFAPFSQTDLRVGAGTAAASGNILVVNYTGWFYDVTKPEQKGLQFDSSAGLSPLEFVLGRGDVIAGWDAGLSGMRAGGLRRLVIPPSLSYGGVRNGIVPANATLVFEVELIEVRSE